MIHLQKGDARPPTGKLVMQCLYDTSRSKIMVCLSSKWKKDEEISKKVSFVMNASMNRNADNTQFTNCVSFESAVEDCTKVANIALREATRPIMDHFCTGELLMWVIGGQHL